VGAYVQSVVPLYQAAEVKCSLPKSGFVVSLILDSSFPRSVPRVFSMKKGVNPAVDDNTLEIDLARVGKVDLPVRLPLLLQRVD
jgi:hypothetical protein